MAAATSSSRWQVQVLVGFLRYHDDPPKLPQEGVDVQCPPFSCSAINLDRDSLPTSFATSSVEDYVNISVTGETLLQRLVHQGNTPRNDKECSLVHIPISTLKRTQITASGCGWTASDRVPPPHDSPPSMLLCLRKLRAMTAWSQRPDSLSIEFRERPTLEHLFQLEVRKSGALLGHVRRNAKGIYQYEPGPLDFHALDVSPGPSRGRSP
jgi:hypothetical protein